VAASLSLGSNARANYDISTSFVTSAGGVSLVGTANTIGSFTDTKFTTGGTTIAAPFGFTELTTGGGSTIWLVNNFVSNQNPGVPNPYAESVYVTAAGADATSFSVTLSVTILDPNGQTTTKGNFTETASYTLAVLAGPPESGGLGIPTGTTSPSSIVVNMHTFMIGPASGTPVPVNNSENNGALGSVITQASAIPEPASVVMLGAGLVGVVTLGVRRRRSRLA
jgi:hypothetical protein